MVQADEIIKWDLWCKKKVIVQSPEAACVQHKLNNTVVGPLLDYSGAPTGATAQSPHIQHSKHHSWSATDSMCVPVLLLTCILCDLPATWHSAALKEKWLVQTNSQAERYKPKTKECKQNKPRSKSSTYSDETSADKPTKE